MSSAAKTAKYYDVFFIGFCLIMSRIPSMWNYGLAYGFWEFFFCVIIMSVANMCLVLCQAEMTSILPFSGGSYGFARVTMGPYVGFVIGCFDAVSNTFYSLLLVQYVCMSIVDTVGDAIPAHSEPFQWLLMYLVCLCIMIGLGRWSFTFITCLGVILALTCLVYVFCTAGQMSFHKYVLTKDLNLLFNGHMSQFMYCLPISNWLFLGPDLVCLVCDDTENARHVVPRVMVACFTVTIVLILVIIVAVSAQNPGFVVLGTIPFPLSPGFSHAFGVSEDVASIFMLPVAFSGLYCLTYIAGRQICAMARSKLLPQTFTETTVDNAPYVALISSALLGYIVLLITYFSFDDYITVLNWVYFASLMCTISAYLVSCISFILFRVRYSSLERCYENKLGIWSALLAILIFSFSFVGSAGYSQDGGLASKVFFGLVGVITVYYVLFARIKQTFSPEEKAVLLKAYVLKANSVHRTFYTWLRRKIKHASSPSSSRTAGYDPDGPPIVGGQVKPKSSSKDLIDRSVLLDYLPMTNEGTAASPTGLTVEGLRILQSRQHSLVLFQEQREEVVFGDEVTVACQNDDVIGGEEHSLEQILPALSREKEEGTGEVAEGIMRREKSWIGSAIKSLNGGTTSRVAPAPADL